MGQKIKIISLILLVCIVSVGAEKKPEIDFAGQGFTQMSATAYCMGTTTYNGSKVHSGGCAVNKEHLGQVAIVYTLDGDFLGYYECNDIGTTDGLKNGYVIDIYRCNLTQCHSFMKLTRGRVWVKWIDGKG